MALEERFVARYVFNSDNVLRAAFYDFVDEQERIAVREQLTYAVNIHQWFCIGVIHRSLYVLTLEFAADLLGECGVDGVTGACGYDFSLEWTSDQCLVAEYVKQFVACGFVIGK